MRVSSRSAAASSKRRSTQVVVLQRPVARRSLTRVCSSDLAAYGVSSGSSSLATTHRARCGRGSAVLAALVERRSLEGLELLLQQHCRSDDPQIVGRKPVIPETVDEPAQRRDVMSKRHLLVETCHTFTNGPIPNAPNFAPRPVGVSRCPLLKGDARVSSAGDGLDIIVLVNDFVHRVGLHNTLDIG